MPLNILEIIDMGQISYGNKKIKFTVKRGSRKKTVAIHIQPNTRVVVLSPQLIENMKIREIVLKRAKWIIEKQEKVKKLRADISKKEFISGETFYYLGRQYRLKVIRSISPEEKCKLLNGRLQVLISKKLKGKAVKEAIRGKLVEWYMERAQEKINERINRYSPQIGKWPKKVIIKNQEKRWGSCSHSGILRFNWKAIMAPMSVLDYIVVHELCHLQYHDHSRKYWHSVESIIPDYKKHRNWLRENSIRLMEF